jgi:hypothetical protein
MSRSRRRETSPPGLSLWDHLVLSIVFTVRWSLVQAVRWYEQSNPGIQLYFGVDERVQLKETTETQPGEWTRVRCIDPWLIHCGVEVTESSTNKQHTHSQLVTQSVIP